MAGPRVLILAATTAYQTDDLVAAAEALGVEPVLAQDRCHILAEDWPKGALAIDFRDPARAARQVIEHCHSRPIVATDEVTSVIAARLAEALGLRRSPLASAEASADKRRQREILRAARLRQPRFELIAANDDPRAAAARIGYPVVIKPLSLSASRGVMRADDDAQLLERAARLRAIVAAPEVEALATSPDAGDLILIEEFVAGSELAFEGLMSGGRLDCLACFDKPDPLDGPFFAETLYITPSRLPADVLAAVVAEVERAAAALGIDEGPLHAELRLAPAPVVLEVASRSIGGLCGRVLRFGAGVSLEQVVIAHALGRPVSIERSGSAAGGVLMLPVTEPGVLTGVAGVEEARAVPGIRDVVITARVGDVMVPLPEGRSYAGFVFADGASPAEVETSLRVARRRLSFTVARRLAS